VYSDGIMRNIGIPAGSSMSGVLGGYLKSVQMVTTNPD
jgi:hypothetical protein